MELMMMVQVQLLKQTFSLLSKRAAAAAAHKVT